MAGDWIKMRVDLHTHPKVVRIVSAVCPQDVRKVSSRCLVVGALHAMWSLFDAHSIDGELRGYGPETLDALVGLDGFAAGVASVDWLVITPNSLAMPNFGTHNGKGAKRRAEDTAAKRVRRMSAECPQDDRTDCGPEKRREEKRTEKENQETPQPPKGGEVSANKPSGGEPAGKSAKAPTFDQVASVLEGRGFVGVEFRTALEAFYAHRKEIKKPISLTTAAAMATKFEQVGQGRAVAAMLDSVANGWQGVFPDKQQAGKKPMANGQMSVDEAVAEMQRRREAKERETA